MTKSNRDIGIITKKDKNGNESYYARITRTDGDGKAKQITQKAESKSHARRLYAELKDKFDSRGENAITGDKMLFRELCDHYETDKLFEARYHGTGANRRKVAGVSSLQTARHYLSVLKTHFGAKRITFITHNDIEKFKLKRLATITKYGRERSVSDVNHSLKLLRAMLRFAITKSWLLESPFLKGKPLISTADENKRDRILSFDEERRLIAVCSEKREMTYTRKDRTTGEPKTVKAFIESRRKHLVPIILTAIETAMRHGELIKLRWRDVDLTKRQIYILATNTKTAKARTVPITEIVFEQLSELWEQSPKDKDAIVFGINDSIKKAFSNARSDAGLENLVFHDLRHTAITRMVEAGMPPMQIMSISGHTQMTTFARYVNADSNTVKRVGDAMNDFRAKQANAL